VPFIASITENAALSIIRPHTGCWIVQQCTLTDLLYFKSLAAKVISHVVENVKKVYAACILFSPMHYLCHVNCIAV